MSERIQLLARDAEINKQYTTELGKLITVVAINRFGEKPEDISGVVVKSADMANAVPISGATVLYQISEQELAAMNAPSTSNNEVSGENVSSEVPVKAPKEKKPKEPKEKKPKEPKAPKEKKPKMSHIMNPMIFEGRPPEEIADAVIAAFPEQAERRSELIGLIKGPRTYNLKQKYPEKFGLSSAPTPVENVAAENVAAENVAAENVTQ